MIDRPLTDRGRAVLERAQHTILEVDADGAWPEHPAVLRALVDRGLLSRTTDEGIARWALTPAGRDALRHAPPRLLAAGGNALVRYRTLPNGRQTIEEADEDALAEHGYTSRPSKALPGEPEAVDPTLIDEWARQSTILHHASQRPDDRAPVDQRIAELREQGRRQQIDLSQDLRVITRELLARGRITPQVERRLDALERRIRRQAA